jgi:hypothetical protein
LGLEATAGGRGWSRSEGSWSMVAGECKERAQARLRPFGRLLGEVGGGRPGKHA